MSIESEAFCYSVFTLNSNKYGWSIYWDKHLKCYYCFSKADHILGNITMLFVAIQFLFFDSVKTGIIT